jgi:hypothetical protein
LKRTSIGKRLRFDIFARDEFTCRYCGRQSDKVIMHIDHVIPVCEGGTNDPENLVTACADCNLGKSSKLIGKAAANETDRLRIAQEMQEQIEAAEMARNSVYARRDRKQQLINFWCGETGRNQVDLQTVAIVFGYVEEFGEAVVYKWVEKAAAKCREDRSIGQYISGIRRSVKAEAEAE